MWQRPTQLAQREIDEIRMELDTVINLQQSQPPSLQTSSVSPLLLGHFLSIQQYKLLCTGLPWCLLCKLTLEGT